MKQALSITFALLASVAWAQQPPASTPAATSPAEAEARKLLQEAVQRYRAAKTYEDTLVVRTEIEAKDESNIRKPPARELAFAFARPNRIALTCEDYSLVCDGQRLWEALLPIEQYIASSAPETLDISKTVLAGFEGVQQLRQHPLLYVVTGAGSVDDLVGPVRSWTGTTEEKKGNEAFRVLTGTLQADGGQPAVSIQVRIARDTGLIREVVRDFTARDREEFRKTPGLEQQIQLIRHTVVHSFENARINGDIPDGRFAFKPRPYDDKVDRFRLLSREEFQDKLIGRPAPDFTEKDLSGKPVRLADLKGRVVLLDFWASWCAPCIMSMPQIQQIAKTYADRPVTVLGINSDKPENRETVAKIVKDKNLTYAQIMDTDDSVSMSYRVMAIPYVILIDRKGVVRYNERGVTPGVESPLVREIDKLLKEPAPAATAPAK